MNEVCYRMALHADLASIFEMFRSATEGLRSQGLDQWDDIYPNEQILAGDVQKKQMHVGVVDGRVMLAFVLNSDCDEQYSNGIWAQDASFRVIHRLCLDPAFQKRGIGKRTMLHIEDLCRAQSIHAIRLDSFEKNLQSTNLYRSLGYKDVGFANWRKGKFHLMEKIL